MTSSSLVGTTSARSPESWVVIRPAADFPCCSLSPRQAWLPRTRRFPAFGSNRGGILADPAGEDDGIDAVEGRAEAKDGFGQTVAENLDGETRAGIALVDRLQKSAHVVAEAGEAKQGRFRDSECS